MSTTPEAVAREALINSARGLLEQGQQEEQLGRIDEATAVYRRAVNALERVKSREGDAAPAHVDELLERAQQLLSAVADLAAQLPEAQRFDAVFSLDRVRVFKIELRSGDKSVASSHRSLLCAGPFQLLQAPSDAGLGLSILKVSPHFQYPLTGDVPCLAMRDGYYVFPTPHAGTFYGLVFPRSLPSAYARAFETLCAAQCQLRRLPADQAAKLPPLPGDDGEEDRPPVPAASSTAVVPSGTQQQQVVAYAAPTFASRTIRSVSDKLESGGEALARGVAQTGVWLASGVARGGSAIRDRITPAVEPLAVRPEVKAGVKAVATVTPHLVFVSKTLIGALLDLAVASGQVIGEAVAQRVNHGEHSDAPRSATKAAVLDFGKSAIVAASNVWDALEAAGTALVDSVGEQTVETVEHKFGTDAAEVASDATHAVGDLMNTAYTVKSVAGKKALKTLGRRAVTKMAKASTVTYFTYEGGEKRTLTIEQGKATPQLLIEGVAPSAPESETDEFHECEDGFGGDDNDDGSELDGQGAEEDHFEEAAEEFAPSAPQ